MRAMNNVLKGSIVEAELLCGSPEIAWKRNKYNSIRFRSRHWQLANGWEGREKKIKMTKSVVWLTHGNFLLQFVGYLLGFLASFPLATLIACLCSGRRRRVLGILQSQTESIRWALLSFFPPSFPGRRYRCSPVVCSTSKEVRGGRREAS